LTLQASGWSYLGGRRSRPLETGRVNVGKGAAPPT